MKHTAVRGADTQQVHRTNFTLATELGLIMSLRDAGKLCATSLFDIQRAGHLQRLRRTASRPCPQQTTKTSRNLSGRHERRERNPFRAHRRRQLKRRRASSPIEIPNSATATRTDHPSQMCFIAGPIIKHRPVITFNVPSRRFLWQPDVRMHGADHHGGQPSQLTHSISQGCTEAAPQCISSSDRTIPIIVSLLQIIGQNEALAQP
jgi:hypothetical protein